MRGLWSILVGLSVACTADPKQPSDDADPEDSGSGADTADSGTPAACDPADAWEPAFGDAADVGSSFAETAQIVVVEVNGDGLDDLVFVNGRNGGDQMRAWFATEPGVYTEGVDLGDARSFGYAGAAGDVDGDGHKDLVVGFDVPNATWLALGSAAGLGEPETIDDPGLGTRDLVLQDLDADGHPDLFLVNRSGPDQLFWNDDGQLTSSEPGPADERLVSTGVAAGDFDGNGLMDLAIANRDPDRPTVHLQTAARTFGSGLTVGTEGLDGRVLAAGDLNGDGLDDLVIGNRAGLDELWWSAGDGTFMAGPELTGSEGGTQSVALSDVNGDCVLDIALAQVEGSSMILLMAEDGTVVDTLASVTRGAGVPYQVLLPDLNGDGRPDLLEARSGGPNQVLLQQ